MLQGIFLLFCAVFHHAVVQRIVQKCPDQFVSAAVRLDGDFIDPGDNFFPDADGKDFVAVLSFGSFRLDNQLFVCHGITSFEHSLCLQRRMRYAIVYVIK